MPKFLGISSKLTPKENSLLSSHALWPTVLEIAQNLSSHGHLAYLAGGAVRDVLRGSEPKDFDIATDASPEDIQKIFKKTIAVGASFGVIVVVENGHSFEVSTFRAEGEYVDGRRPSSVDFCTPEKDALRRDFTINALFFDISKGEVRDFVGGKKDITDKVIRCVGDAEKRFNEDHLRILRAFRFESQLGFKIEEKTLAAAIKHKEKVALVSAERKREELEKLLLGDEAPRAIEKIYDLGVLSQIAPEISVHWQGNIAGKAKTLLLLSSSPLRLQSEQATLFKWIALFISLPQAPLDKSLKALKFSNADFSKITKTVDYVSKFNSILKERLGIQREIFSSEEGQLTLSIVEKTGEIEKSVIQKLQSLAAPLPQPLLNGEDLKKLGFTSGPTMGQALRETFLLQLETPSMTKEEALGICEALQK